MRRPDDTDPSPQKTYRAELAAIFAAAILRLHQRMALAPSESSEEAKTCPEVPAETVLSGHHG